MSKAKTSAVVGAIGVLLAASGITGYKLVKTKNYGATEENLHQVSRVLDGDTFEIEGDKKGETIKVRILNATAPEENECYFKESKKALDDLIGGKKVRLDKDISGEDNFGRLLRHVVLPSDSEKEDDVLVSKFLVENGFARALAVYPDARFKTYLARFGNKAERDKKGVWGNCQQLPKDFQDVADTEPDDSDCVIKGNISETDKEKRYFLPDCPSYSQIKIDLKKGEAYFCSEKEAKSAGFSLSESCENVFKAGIDQ